MTEYQLPPPSRAVCVMVSEVGSTHMTPKGDYYSAKDVLQAYAAGREARPVCLWNNVDGCWETTCGNAFEINDGTPSENNMTYCCYCGGKVEEDIK